MRQRAARSRPASTPFQRRQPRRASEHHAKFLSTECHDGHIARSKPSREDDGCAVACGSSPETEACDRSARSGRKPAGGNVVTEHPGEERRGIRIVERGGQHGEVYLLASGREGRLRGRGRLVVARRCRAARVGRARGRPLAAPLVTGLHSHVQAEMSCANEPARPSHVGIADSRGFRRRERSTGSS